MPVSYLALRADLVERGGMADAGAALCRRLTAALDADLASLLPRDGGRLALVAVGGYGRGELCLYSDVDLMLLHTGSVPARAVEQTFYPLWDAGLKVGHAVRSVREAVQAAREQFETLTALLDARLLAGDDDLFGELRHALGELLRRGRIDLTGELAARERVRRQAEPYLLQELNIKDGRGGLRALQSMHWERRAAEIRALTPRPPLPSRRERGSHNQPRQNVDLPRPRRRARGRGCGSPDDRPLNDREDIGTGRITAPQRAETSRSTAFTGPATLA
jgi:hypothetical protein